MSHHRTQYRQPTRRSPASSMPLHEAMMTQRAVRRVQPDPVDDAVVLQVHRARPARAHRLQRAELGVHRRQGPARQRPTRQALSPGLGALRRGRQAGRPQRRIPAEDPARGAVAGRPLQRDSRPGRALPARNPPAVRAARRSSVSRRSSARSIPACRTCCWPPAAMGLGASLITLPLWSVTLGPQDPRTSADGHPGLHRPARLAEGTLRPDHPQAGRRGDPPGLLRQPGLVQRLGFAPLFSRTRTLIRIGVPSNPNVSRSRRSRNRR